MERKLTIRNRFWGTDGRMVAFKFTMNQEKNCCSGTQNVCVGTKVCGILSIGVKIHTPFDLLQGAGNGLERK